jgi:excisionase family DNA binding protein
MATAPTQQLNVRETARRLGVHENTVRNWADRGVLRPLRLPGSGYRRFDVADVDRIAREMREAAAPVEETRAVRPTGGRAVGRDAWE